MWRDSLNQEQNLFILQKRTQLTTCCALREVPGDFLPGGPTAQGCYYREEQGCHGDCPSGVSASQEWEHDWGEVNIQQSDVLLYFHKNVSSNRD